MSGEAIFLSKELFNHNLGLSKPSEANQTTSFISYFFGQYYKVLRKEIWERSKITFEGKVLPSENTEFLQAVYELHLTSITSNNDHPFTPAILAKHLRAILGSFLNVENPLAINIDGPQFNACVATTKKMLEQIEKHPALKNAHLKTLLNSEQKIEPDAEQKNEPKPICADAYKALQEAYKDAFLEIRKLINVNAVQRHNAQLMEIRNYLKKAQELTQDWSLKIKALKTTFNKNAIITKQEWKLFNFLDNCIDEIKTLDNFIKNPTVKKISDNLSIKTGTPSYLEFHVDFIKKANSLLTKIKENLAHEEDPEYYKKKYDKIAKELRDKARLENIRKATQELINNGILPDAVENEAKEEKINNPDLSAPLLTKSEQELMELGKTFLAYYQKFDELITTLAPLREKRDKRDKASKQVPPFSKDDLNTGAIQAGLQQAKDKKASESQDDLNLRPQLTVNVLLAENNESKSDFVLTPMAKEAEEAKQGKKAKHNKHFSFGYSRKPRPSVSVVEDIRATFRRFLGSRSSV